MNEIVSQFKPEKMTDMYGQSPYRTEKRVNYNK